MIFSNYRDLINFVLSNYPYSKIINYSKDNNYTWGFSKKCGEKIIQYGRFPTKTDIKRCLVSGLSLLCYRDIQDCAIPIIYVNSNISELFRHYNVNDYFSINFRKDRTELHIKYNYRFSNYMFSKYSLPSDHYKWPNKKTIVVFKFGGDQII